MRRASNLLGKQMLLARRLCEAGGGFVTVSDCGWDMHANGNSPKKMANLPPMASQVDHAVAAFLEDVHERGLSDRILLVVTGEMGRTPRRNRDGGRDHYANLTTLALAGGGLKMGQVIGQSDSKAVAARLAALHAEGSDGDDPAHPARSGQGAPDAGPGPRRQHRERRRADPRVDVSVLRPHRWNRSTRVAPSSEPEVVAVAERLGEVLLVRHQQDAAASGSAGSATPGSSPAGPGCRGSRSPRR